MGIVPGAAELRRRAAALPADRYSILGADVSLRTDSDSVRAFFSASYRWFPAGEAREDLDLVALFRNQGATPGASAGDSFLDLSRSRSPENRAFLFLLESLTDRISTSIMLHGAAVSAGGKGIIIAGPTLAGKSTLVLELMKLGHRFLSDDAAPLERSSGRLLPFPRAVGMRKGGASTRLPERGVHELPHKWLVDPVSLGARLPVDSCEPDFLFYLDPGEGEAERDQYPRTFELALADSSQAVEADLVAMGAESVLASDTGPFIVLTARFRPGARPFSGLVEVWRRHRDTILYIDESRPPVRRSDGSPRIVPVEVSRLLLPLVRDVLNRGEAGALMRSHSGKLTSLMVEIAGLLKTVKCFKVTASSPEKTAAAINEIVHGTRRNE